MMGRRHNGKPVAFVPACAPSKMGQLDHDRGALLVHRVVICLIHGTISSL